MKFEKIKQDQYVIDDHLEIDDYVPLKITLSSNDIFEEKNYYRFLNNDGSFIEISIDMNKFQIIDINFLLIKKISSKNKFSDLNINENLKGIPIVESSVFIENSQVTENTEFEIYLLNTNEIFFDFKKEYFYRVATANHIEFYFDEDLKLAGIKIRGFQKKEWKKLVETIYWNINEN